MALTQKDLDRILNSQGAVQRAFDANQPTVTAQRPSSPSLQGIANVLNAIRQPLDVYGLNKNIPLVGGMTAADVTGLNQVAPLTEDIAYGRPVMRGGSLQTMQADPRLAGFVDLIPTAALATKGGKAAAKAGLKEVARQIETGTGAFGKGTIDPRMYAYLPDTPKNRNPLVGTRFESQAQGNLVPEVPLKIEDLKGGSIKIVPYDLTNADQLITSVSDEALQNPVYTMGGKNFSRLQQNYLNNIGGASNLEIAKRVANRIDTTRAENLKQGGTGEVYKLPMTMGQNSEFFSTYPTDILKQLAIQNGDKKSIKQLNEFLRNAPVATPKGQVRPFGNFKGIETPEGQQQLLTGEGFGAKGTAGEFRKAFAAEMAKTRNEKAFNYNFEDVRNSVLDPDLINLPKGMAGNTVVKALENTPLTPSSLGSKIGAYDTDIAGQYFGRLNTTPVDILMPKTYNNLYKIFESKYPSKHPEALRNMTIAAMEKRKENIGEFIDQEVIDNYYKYQEGLLRK
jgi:hypothetical protein